MDPSAPRCLQHSEREISSEKKYILQTDVALKALQKTTVAGARVARWVLALQAYDFEVVHKPGAQHANADDLSRQAWEVVPEKPLPGEHLHGEPQQEYEQGPGE